MQGNLRNEKGTLGRFYGGAVAYYNFRVAIIVDDATAKQVTSGLLQGLSDQFFEFFILGGTRAGSSLVSRSLESKLFVVGRIPSSGIAKELVCTSSDNGSLACILHLFVLTDNESSGRSKDSHGNARATRQHFCRNVLREME